MAFACRVDIAGVEADDFVGVAGRGIEASHAAPVDAVGADLLGKFAFDRVKGVFAPFKLAGGQFENIFAVGITILTDKGNLTVCGERRNSHPARVFNDFPDRRAAVWQRHVIHAKIDDSSSEMVGLRKCFFFEVHV